MSKYLYGAAVQGIQDFIFKTNKLREIVGASELVEQICTTAFDEFAQNGESVVRAAGNIKFIFDKESDCQRAVSEFPKKVMTKAPGITISQAVVNMDGKDFGTAVDELEQRLKTQRNKVPQSVTLGLLGIKRTNNTGLPVTVINDKDGKPQQYLDDATSAKLDIGARVWELCRKSFVGKDEKGLYIPVRKENIPYELKYITDKNDWIAIIHADGNGLGKVIQKVGKKKDVLKKFSGKLDEATTAAANTTFKKIVEEHHISTDGIIPIRPVVLDGDDMTVIIRGDLAIAYAKYFMEAFEKETKDRIGGILEAFEKETEDRIGGILKSEKVFDSGENYLTACAGIAFIKASYPFYYGYQLAEELCGQAKKDTKALVGENALPKSCLMFHKVQDSFITRYEDIVTRELTAKDDLSFKAGPYYLKETQDKFTIEQLTSYSEKLDNENGDGIRSGIRNWISLRLKNKEIADQRKRRMLQIFFKIFHEQDEKANKQDIISKLTNEDNNVCIAYDVLAYHTIMNQKTNE